MRYLTAILRDDLKFAFTARQPTYFVRVLWALVRYRKNTVFWKTRIVTKYRSTRLDKGTAFYVSFDGLPKLTDHINGDFE